MLVCGAIRFVQNAITIAFFIVVLSGGLDTYTDTYDSIAGRLPLLPEGSQAALIADARRAGGLDRVRQRRAGARLPARRSQLARDRPSRAAATLAGAGAEATSARYTFDPRAVALAAAIAFAVLIASTAWAVLASVAAFLVVASIAARGDRSVAARRPRPGGAADAASCSRSR